MSDAASNEGSSVATTAADVISAYDESLVPSLFGPWAEVLLDAVRVAPGDHVLDVATGPGTVARPAAIRAGATGRVVACDISPAMLDVGRRKPAQQDAAPIRWVESLAAPLAFADGTFNVVTCQQAYSSAALWSRPSPPTWLRCHLRAASRSSVLRNSGSRR
ncbi:MAG: methyltransferase domain-containing protein [Pseudonocardiales bacterium]